MTPELQSRLARIQRRALLLGVIALAASVPGAFARPAQFFFSYLSAYVFWFGLSLGCFLIAMMHQLTGGRWGYPTRRFLEAGFMVLPLLLLLFGPILVGLKAVYPWAQPATIAADEVLQHRRPWLNHWAYAARALLFFGLWILMAARLRAWSLAQDQTADAAPTRKARTLSGPGIVLLGLSGTFAVVDWLLSLEPHWHSTMFAVIVIIGHILTALAFVIVVLALFRNREPIESAIQPVHFHQLGNLLLTFVLFWTYVSFGELLIVYSGDLPREVDWYLHRIAGGWKTVIVGLALFHFFVPFFLLLFRAVKRNVAALATLAGLLFAMHYVHTWWLVMPALHPHDVAGSWLDFTLPIGIGGLWLSAFCARLKAAPLLPRNDPIGQFAPVYGR